MKCSTKIIAAVVAAALILSLIPAALALSSANIKKAEENPMPMRLDEDSALTLELFNGEEYPMFKLYTADSLVSQRIQMDYGLEKVDRIFFDGRTLNFFIEADTKEAYGLSDATAQYYINGMKYRAGGRMKYDHGETIGATENWNVSILPLEEVSVYFLDSIDVEPKYGEEDDFMCVPDSYKYWMRSRILGNPTFNFFITNGPAVVGTDYNPAERKLYDKSFGEGSLEEDLEFTLKTDAAGADLYASADATPSIQCMESDEEPRALNSAGIVIPAEGERANEIKITLKAEYLNTLKVGNYRIYLPFENGKSVILLKVTEGPCKGGEGCPSAAYTDLDPDQWYHQAVDFAIENGLMVGNGNGTFSPARKMTRAMLVTTLWSIHGKPAATQSANFADVASDAWYADAVDWAKEKGYISGYNATTFAPNDIITREQLATILWNYVKTNGGDVTAAPAPEVLGSFNDADKISSWAEDAMTWCCDNGLFSGKGGGKLDPKGGATRAEVAQVLVNFLLLSIRED